MRPDDLAAWARAAAATRLAPPPPRLAIESLDLDFPDKQGQRLVTRILLGLAPPGAEGGVEVAAEDGKDRIKLTVEGTIEREGQSFEEFRMRFRLPSPASDGLVALLLERRLRPDQPFLLRMKVRDEVSGAEARVAKGFLVPEKPEARLARTDAGPVPLRLTRMYLDETLAEVVRSARVLSSSRQITIDLSGETSAAMIGDEDLVKRLFVNLLDNAIRFSPDRSTIRIELLKTGAGYDASVIDQGSGIPAHAQTAVFERFFRGDPSRARGQGSASGAGLGLSLARWIARAHGGDVVVAGSGPGGTTFKVSLAAGEETRL
jgi:hypothetical protein